MLSSIHRPTNRRHAIRRKSPSRISDAAIRRRTQRFSATSPRTSLALGKLPMRRNSLSPVSAMSTSEVAGLGRDSLLYSGGTASLYQYVACADRPHNPTNEQSNTCCYNTILIYIFEYIVNSILQHIEMSQTLYNSQFRQFTTSLNNDIRIFLVPAHLSARDKLTDSHVLSPGPPPSRREHRREVTQTT